MSWDKVKLGDIADVRDGTHDSPKYCITGYPLITSKNIKDGTIDFSEANYISEQDFIAINKRSKVDKGDILLPMIGTIGNPVIVYDEPVFAIKNVCLIKHSKNIDNRYLCYVLKSNLFYSTLLNKSRGGTQKFISLGDIRSFEIPLPSLRTQKQIAAILDAADALKRKDQELLKKYDELAQAIFIDMFGDPELFDRNVPLHDLAAKGKHTFNNGPFGSDLLTSELKNEGVPVIYIRDIRNAVFNWKSEVYVTPEKAEYLRASKVISGDLLIAKVGDPPGACAIYPENLPDAIITQDVIRIRLDTKIVLPHYLQFYLNSYMGEKQLKSIIVEGTRSRFSLGEYKKISIPVPSMKNQIEFTSRINFVKKGKDCFNKNVSSTLFSSLLQKAFKGELVREEELV